MDARLGKRRSSKWTTLRFSAAGFFLRGTAGFLNGSVPDDLAHGWQRKPEGVVDTVYFVYFGVESLTEREVKCGAYHSKLVSTFRAILEASDRRFFVVLPHLRKSSVRIIGAAV